MSGEHTPEHQPTYYVAHGRGWVECACGWLSNPKINGNQQWAQQQFARHLIEVPR